MGVSTPIPQYCFSCMEPVTVTSWIVKITKISSNILIQKVLPASFEVPFYQGTKKEAFSTFWGLMGSLSRNDILSLLAAPPGKRMSVLHTQLLSLLLLCITIKHYGAKNTKKAIIYEIRTVCLKRIKMNGFCFLFIAEFFPFLAQCALRSALSSL